MTKKKEEQVIRIKGVRLSSRDTCRVLGVTRMTLSRWVNAGKIKCEKSRATGRLYFTFLENTPRTILNIVSSEEAANMLSITPCRLSQLVKRGDIEPLPGIKPRKFAVRDVQALKESRNQLSDEDAVPVLSVGDLLENDNIRKWRI